MSAGEEGFVAYGISMSEEQVYEKLVEYYAKGTEDSDGSDLVFLTNQCILNKLKNKFTNAENTLIMKRSIT